MRLLRAFILCLLLSLVALSQTKPVLEHKGELVFWDSPEARILAHKFLDGENRLLLVGNRIVRVVDVAEGKFSETHAIELPEFYWDKPRLISPDGRRMLAFGNYGSPNKGDKVKQPTSVWDLRTGKRVAVLDKTRKQIRAAVWSKNGKTLATSSDQYAPIGADSTGLEVAFWDGETFEYKNSLPSDKAARWFLSDDGRKCIFSGSESKNLIIDKWINTTGPLGVWDIDGGKLEQTITARDGNIERKIRSIVVSPDGKFLTFVAQPPKSNNTERRLAVWEIPADDSPLYEIRPKYELKPAPKIYEYGASFSPDGKYLSFPAGKSVQIYDAQTGEKKLEMPGDRSPSFWAAGNRILIFYYGESLEAFEAATGRHLYQQKLVSEWTTSSDGDSQYNVPVDTTTIVIHPGGDLFLTYSNQYVKVFDARTGELLQTLVSPPTDYSKKKPRLSDKSLVSKADWSPDGKTLYVIDAGEKSVSLWRLLKN